ncbi:MAG: hypothetical protein RSG77_27280, partial [Hafnia sp.]
GKIKACDDIEAGQQLTHTLNWIDTVLASDCLTGIGVGGALKAEKKEYDANPDSRLAAARTPFVRSTPEHPSVDTSGGQKSPSGSSKLPGLNTVLPKIRSELQALQVEMALNYCATTASTQTSNAKAMISQLDTIKEGPIKLTEGSNLSQTQYAAARICQDMNDALAAKITQIQQNLADFKTWSNDYKEASNALVTLCGGVNECYKSDRGRSDWVGQIKGWHEQYKHVRKPNAEGCLDMGAVEFSKLLNNLNTPKISRSDWVYHAFTVTSTLSAMLSGDPLPESHPQPIKEEHTDFLKRKADDVAFKRKVDGQCHALSARIEFSRDRVGENMAQIGVINLCDTTSAMLDHIEKKGSQSADDIRTIRSAMKNALATTQEIGSPSPEQTSKTAALVVKVDGALKHLMDFFDVNMFNAHRSEIRDIYTNHLKTYAYFDHPQTQAITNNVTNILRNEDFQKNIRAHIQAHGLTVAQLATQQPNTVSTGREAFV